MVTEGDCGKVHFPLADHFNLDIDWVREELVEEEVCVVDEEPAAGQRGQQPEHRLDRTWSQHTSTLLGIGRRSFVQSAAGSSIYQKLTL